MRLGEIRRRIRMARAAGAVALSACLILDGVPAAAQRRGAEPEANPDFQNQMKAGQGGGPVAEPGGGAPAAPLGAAPSPAAPASDTPQLGGAENLAEPRAVQSVQIGAAPAPKPAAATAGDALDTRVTVRVKGVPLATFLDTISAQAKVNFIITEGLEQKRVTAFLQNVTVRDALQVLLEIKGLSYQRIGKTHTYVVTQRSKQAENLITRIYQLSYIPLIALTADDSLDRETALQGTVGGAGLGGGGGGGNNNAKPCERKNQKVTIARILCSVLTKSGDIEIEPRTNALVVTDIPEIFPQVEQIIAELDKKAPQVMIEAQIVEIDSTRTHNLGFEWGGTNGELGSYTGGERDTSFPLAIPKTIQNTHFFDPVNGVISSIGGAASPGGGAGTPVIGSFIKTSVLDLTQLKVTLRALVANSEARFLGKPKILTLNNKTSTIEITRKQAVAEQSTLTGGQSVSQASSQAERFDTGVKLKVTPQVNRDGYITMLLVPTFTDVSESVVSTAANPVFDPLSRTSTSLVRVKNGETIVLSGLLSSNESKAVRKVPFLGYIPLLGWLFTSTLYTRTNTDLVVFVTPTILTD